jgi:hypothetical protein
MFVVNSGINEQAAFAIADVCTVAAASTAKRHIAQHFGTFMGSGVEFYRFVCCRITNVMLLLGNDVAGYVGTRHVDLNCIKETG